MEKTNWQKAKWYFMRALKIVNEENPEIMRCYWLCEYRLWHREDGMWYLQRAYASNQRDAEILLNLIEISIMEELWEEAKEYIMVYKKHKWEMQFFDRTLEYYEQKILLFDTYIQTHIQEWAPKKAKKKILDDEDSDESIV